MHFSRRIGAALLLTSLASAQINNSTLSTSTKTSSHIHHRFRPHHNFGKNTSLPISATASSTDFASTCPSANNTSIITVTVTLTSNILPGSSSTLSTSWLNASSSSSSSSSSLSSNLAAAAMSGSTTTITLSAATLGDSSSTSSTEFGTSFLSTTSLSVSAFVSSITNSSSTNLLSIFPSSSANLSSTTSLSSDLLSSTASSSPIASASISTFLSSTANYLLTTSLIVSASPISTASSVSYPNATIAPTTTISSGMASGTPDPSALLCGVHGLPVGDYSLAEYWEDTADVPVTLLDCYFYCATGYGYNMGCLSYEFYPEPGTGSVRCRLYGGSVADSIDSIVPQVPDEWYDLGCGIPT